MTGIRNTYIMILAGLCLLSSCVERDLKEYTHGWLDLRVSWPADCATSEAEVWLYGADGRLLSASRCASGGQRFELPAGEYGVVVMNGNPTHVAADGTEALHTHHIEALTREDGEGGLMSVGNVFACGTEHVRVEPRVVRELTLHPENRVRMIHFVVKAVSTRSGGSPGVKVRSIRMDGVLPWIYSLDGQADGAVLGAVTVTASPDASGGFTAQAGVLGWDDRQRVEMEVEDESGVYDAPPVDISHHLEDLPEEGGTITVTLDLPEERGRLLLTATVVPWNRKDGEASADVE